MVLPIFYMRGDSMANEMQSSILKAIDILVNNKIDSLEVDRTITAIITKCVNIVTGEYKVEYQGGIFTAYAQDLEATYTQNQAVYVLVPEANFSKKKYIIGEAASTKNEETLTYVSEVLDNYDEIGRNIIINNSGQDDFGLHSYLAEEYILLYDREHPEHSLFTINEAEFSNYLRETEAISIKGTFKTHLPGEHKVSKTGSYGIQVVLAFKDREGTTEKKFYSYNLNSREMTGNPYNYESGWFTQYRVYPIDVENFLYVSSIMLYSEGFETADNTEKNEEWGADIWARDIGIYGLRASASDGEYKLKISTPYGATFGTASSESKLEAVATFRKSTTILNNDTTFYWFVEDARVRADDPNYSYYAGAGWKKLDESSNKLTLTANENRAYENKYLCIAVYQNSVILQSKFSIYNEANKRLIEITSNLGTKFSFDCGIPLLTCYVNNKQSDFGERPDLDYRFIWQKIDAYGNVEVMDKSVEELQAELDKLIEEEASYQRQKAKQIEIDLLTGVEFPRGVNGNQLQYPIKQIDKSLTIKCSVYLRDTTGEYFIGSDEIVLLNRDTAGDELYTIYIVNGNQVFQYSESGVAPDDERYKDPQEILPLSCKFYDPSGVEIDISSITVRWTVPLENTMIEAPQEGMVINPSNNQAEWYEQQIFPLAIKSDFDYAASDNQVLCTINYSGTNYTQYSNLLFLKVGDNGTNGTDMVAKIDPIQTLDNEPLTLEWSSTNTFTWNTGQQIYATPLEFKLFERNQEIPPEDVLWSIAGSSSKYMSINEGTGVVSFDRTGDTYGKYRNLIVKGQTTIPTENGSTTYYAHYPIPVVHYITAASYHVGISYRDYLKQILYNSNGYNPLYSQNQGVKVKLTSSSSGTVLPDKQIRFTAQGGINENATTAAFTISKDRGEEQGVATLTLTTDALGEAMVYICPDEFYSGAFTNNNVYCEVLNGSTVECEFWVPINMLLNTYGLQSLNEWDGNHIEINEDQDYVLAPQIGAGQKERNNTFTGIVMGTSQTFDEQDVRIGLQGFSKGKQSIFLDAETGNAYFGLPEDDPADPNNPETEGRIELIPGGISSISRWKIDSRSLYNVIDGEIGDAYSDAPSGAKRSVPHDKQGILLNADPTYISAKGKQLTSSEIDTTNGLNVVDAGDSLEVEIDPSKLSIFTIYHHYRDANSRWQRHPLVGIDGNGQFYSNTLKKDVGSVDDRNSIATSLGYVGAFGASAATKSYVGNVINIGSLSSPRALFKAFAETSKMNDATGALYLSGATSTTSEYQRDMNLYGKSINLYASSTANTAKTTDYKLELSNTAARFGIFTESTTTTPRKSYIELLSSGQSKLEVAGSLIVSSNSAMSLTSQSTLNLSASSTSDIYAKSSMAVRSSSTITLTSGDGASSTSNSYGITLTCSGTGARINLNSGTNSYVSINTYLSVPRITTSNTTSYTSTSCAINTYDIRGHEIYLSIASSNARSGVGAWINSHQAAYNSLADYVDDIASYVGNGYTYYIDYQNCYNIFDVITTMTRQISNLISDTSSLQNYYNSLERNFRQHQHYGGDTTSTPFW